MRALALALLLGSTLAACTMPGATDDATRLETTAGQRAPDAPASTSGEAGGPAATPPAQGDRPDMGPVLPPGQDAPPVSDPLPPERAPDPGPAAAPPEPDRSCRTSADCVVKNVGNCCGAMPACVNKDARTDPAAVQAHCARQGMASICGFNEISSCACVAGTCQDAGEAVAR